jgi:radical SAM superfamily enzyme YgiQ (UPF0313 family)
MALINIDLPAKRNELIRPFDLKSKILLVKLPYFSPWTPPLGISNIKTFLNNNGYYVKCFDFNTDPDLWGMHHAYFKVLLATDDKTDNDGYSKLWWILNAHMLAYANNATPGACAKVLQTIIPYYGIKYERGAVDKLILLVDKFFGRLNKMIDQLDLSDYSVVGTSTYSTSLATSLFFLKQIKKKYPSIKNVMGGGIFADDLALGSENLEILVGNYDYVDHVILGEGELLFLKFLQGKMAGKRVISLPDLNGETLQMKDVPAPDFTDFDLDRYYQLSIEGARSCPFQCSFCSETIQWGDYRKKPKDLFASQVIGLAEKYRNNTFFMGDSLMNPYIGDFSNELLKRNARILYDGYLRADKPVADRERVKNWARSGLYRVRLGIESAAPRVLGLMDKMTNPRIISEVLKSLANAGVRTTTYWVVGFPGETEEDFQETLNFIEEHHKYIYELEAHPYYYYPYGQVGSRLHKSYPIYPDEVTEIIKFKVWEIIDVQPSREERYERLQRISKLARKLGVPNIYTMSERFEAEDRWQWLHPLTAEVYEGTKVSRKAEEPPSNQVEVFSQDYREGESGRLNGLNSILCYRVSVKKNLNDDILQEATHELLRSNMMLQMRLENGKYIATPPTREMSRKSILAIHSIAGNEDHDRAGFETRLIEEISPSIRPEPGHSIRAVLVKTESGHNKFYLLAHKALVDGQSIKLLLEDLFRIYEQLSENKPVTLRPVRQSYLDFVRTANALEGPDTISSNRDEKNALRPGDGEFDERAVFDDPLQGDVKVITRPVEGGLGKKLRSGAFSDLGLKPVEIALYSLLRSITKAQGSEASLAVDWRYDYRIVNEPMEYTVCALSSVSHIPAKKITEIDRACESHDINRRLKSYAGEVNVIKNAPPSRYFARRGEILFNCEYFVEEPWLGGDTWVPEGFVNCDSDSAGEYLIEITPLCVSDGIQLRICHKRHAFVERLAARIIDHLLNELNETVVEWDQYLDAKQFWLNEVDGQVPTNNLDLVTTHVHNAPAQQSNISCAVDKSIMDQARTEFSVKIETLLLSIYSILLSRLNGKEELVILTSLDTAEGRKITPIRLCLRRAFTFREYVNYVEQRINRALKHGQYALDILKDAFHLPGTEGGEALLFDVAYIHRNSPDGGKSYPMIEYGFNEEGPVDRAPKLILEVVQEGDNTTLNIIYNGVQSTEAVVKELSSHLTYILRNVIVNKDVLLGEISLSIASDHYIMDSRRINELLSKNNFAF